MYNLLWDARIKKDLRGIDKTEQKRIITKCHEILTTDPFIGKAMTGRYSGMYRLRIGDYRVIYSIYQESVTVRIAKIGHRKDIYEH